MRYSEMILNNLNVDLTDNVIMILVW